MYKNSNGYSSQGVKWGKNVTRWFCIKPVDFVAFADYDKCLEKMQHN